MSERRGQTHDGDDESPEHFNEQDRADERGDAAEPDAPLTVEHNEGMSTILDGEAGIGVQDRLGE